MQYSLLAGQSTDVVFTSTTFGRALFIYPHLSCLFVSSITQDVVGAFLPSSLRASTQHIEDVYKDVLYKFMVIIRSLPVDNNE